MAHACNPSTRRQRLAVLCEFKASLVYKVNFRTARGTQRNSVLKNQTKPTKPKQKECEKLLFPHLTVCFCLVTAILTELKSYLITYF